MSSSFRKLMTVYSPAVRTLDDNGYWQDTAFPSTYTIYASLQPATGKDMQALPEGRRASGGFVLFSDTLLGLIVTTPDAPKNPDFILINGDQYEAVILNPWQNNVINNYQYIMQKREVPTPLS